ncbi:MAG: SDR family NAD(P)-dependent oxidoreductase, partial [Caldilineaceae bacterium]|nr:SDR family NAD(P)-dependent oxidoreductase [Caldilineaceae bacterium]
MEFENKTVLITGGASGMGAASARLFVEAGANVIIVDRNGELAQQTAAE